MVEYKYILFELVDTEANSNLKETLNDLFLNKLKASNLFYPTHDGKVYTVFKFDLNLISLEDKLNQKNGLLNENGLKLKVVRVKNNSFVNFFFLCEYLILL